MKSVLNELDSLIFDSGYTHLTPLYNELSTLYDLITGEWDTTDFEDINDLETLLQDYETDFYNLVEAHKTDLERCQEVSSVVAWLHAIKEPTDTYISAVSESTYLTYGIKDIDLILDHIYTNDYIGKWFDINNWIDGTDYSDRTTFIIRVSGHDVGSYMDLRHGGITYYENSDVEITYKF